MSSMADIFAAANALTAASIVGTPNDYNGALGSVDLSAPTDFVSESGKICTTGHGANRTFALKDTLMYYMWLAQEKPDVATDVTEAHVSAFWELGMLAMARARIYSILAAAGVVIEYRATDIATLPDAAVLKGNFVNRITTLVNSTAELENQVAIAGCNILHSFFANALHRDIMDGHSWMTADTDKINTNTGRLTAVAGSQRREFAQYMRAHGHDGNHHLSTVALTAICNAISGIDSRTVPAGGTVLGVADGTPVNYAGRNIRNVTIDTIFTVSEAATDRWPSKGMGKSAFILGLEALSAMLTHITSRVHVSGLGNLGGLIYMMASGLRESRLDREALRQLDSRLGPVVSLAYGYVVHSDIFSAGKYESLKKHSERYPSAVAQGGAISDAVRSAKVNPKAVGDAVTTAISGIRSSLNAITDLRVTEGGERVFMGTGPVPVEDISAEVGPDENAQMLRLLAAARGDAFTDAMSG